MAYSIQELDTNIWTIDFSLTLKVVQAKPELVEDCLRERAKFVSSRHDILERGVAKKLMKYVKAIKGMEEMEAAARGGVASIFG